MGYTRTGRERRDHFDTDETRRECHKKNHEHLPAWLDQAIDTRAQLNERSLWKRTRTASDLTFIFCAGSLSGLEAVPITTPSTLQQD